MVHRSRAASRTGVAIDQAAFLVWQWLLSISWAKVVWWIGDPVPFSVLHELVVVVGWPVHMAISPLPWSPVDSQIVLSAGGGK